MRRLRRTWTVAWTAACVAVCVVAGAAWTTNAAAAGHYLFDAIKAPAYLRSLKTVLAGARELPEWTRNLTLEKGDYVGSPGETVAVEGARYETFFACKAHACDTDQFEVMFAPNGAQAWAAIRVDGGALMFLGAPNPAMQAALRPAFTH